MCQSLAHPATCAACVESLVCALHQSLLLHRLSPLPLLFSPFYSPPSILPPWTSPDAVRALLACRGLPTLMAFLETDYCNNRAFVHIGLDCLLAVLAAGRPTPRTDMARQLARMGMLHRLLSLLHSVSSARNHPASASSAGAGAGAGAGEGGGEGAGRSSWDGGAAGSGAGSAYGLGDAYGSGNTGGAGVGTGGGGAASTAASPATSSSAASAAAPAAATPARRSQRRIFGLAQFRSKAAKAGQGGGDSQAQGGATSSSSAAAAGGAGGGSGGGVAGGSGGSFSGGNGAGTGSGGYGTSAAVGGAAGDRGGSSGFSSSSYSSSSATGTAAAVKQQQLDPAALAAQDTLYLTRTALLLLHLCQADEAVRAHMLAPSFLKRLLDARESLPPPVLLLLLRVLRQLSADAASHDSLQRADAVGALVPYIRPQLVRKFLPTPLALMALYNLCRGSKRRQELAAEASIVPPLMALISSCSPLLPFALPLLCLLATASRAACDTLLHHNAMPLLLSLLAAPLTPHAAIAARLADSRKDGAGGKGAGGGGGVAGGAAGAGAPGGAGGTGGVGSGEGAERMWGAAAFEAVVACVVNDGEGRHVEQTLLRRDSLEALVWFVRGAAKTPSFTTLFEPLLRLVTKLPTLNAALSEGGLGDLLVARLLVPFTSPVAPTLYVFPLSHPTPSTSHNSKSPTLNAALSVGGLGDLLVARLDEPQLEPAVRLNLLKLLKVRTGRPSAWSHSAPQPSQVAQCEIVIHTSAPKGNCHHCPPSSLFPPPYQSIRQAVVNEQHPHPEGPCVRLQIGNAVNSLNLNITVPLPPPPFPSTPFPLHPLSPPPPFPSTPLPLHPPLLPGGIRATPVPQGAVCAGGVARKVAAVNRGAAHRRWAAGAGATDGLGSAQRAALRPAQINASHKAGWRGS
ncbi:unnamed protein product [Closterium sp. NIES-54]